MPDIATNFDENVIWVGAAGFEAHADRLIILQDESRSGFECGKCLDKNKHTVQGREVSTIPCVACQGKGRRPKAGNPDLVVKCSDCGGEGWIICPDCEGKGGTLVFSDKQKLRPTTGVIVSIGPDVGDKCLACMGKGIQTFTTVSNGPHTENCAVCKGKGLVPTWKRGDKCIYPSTAGFAYDLEGRTEEGKVVECVLIILRDQDILSKMHGLLEQNQVKRSAALHTLA